MAAAEPIRLKDDIHKIADYFLQRGQLRNYLLIVLGVYTALRIGDLLRLTWCDVYDFDRYSMRKHIQLTEQKTGKKKSIALNGDALCVLEQYLRYLSSVDPETYLFQSTRLPNSPITRVQAYRLIRKAASEVGLQEQISCHSLRKTFGYHAWKSGAPVAVIMDIYNHSSLEITKRYLGVSQDDRDMVYLQMHLW